VQAIIEERTVDPLTLDEMFGVTRTTGVIQLIEGSS
jgi:hypothetical protein